MLFVDMVKALFSSAPAEISSNTKAADSIVHEKIPSDIKIKSATTQPARKASTSFLDHMVNCFVIPWRALWNIKETAPIKASASVKPVSRDEKAALLPLLMFGKKDQIKFKEQFTNNNSGISNAQIHAIFLYAGMCSNDGSTAELVNAEDLKKGMEILPTLLGSSSFNEDMDAILCNTHSRPVPDYVKSFQTLLRKYKERAYIDIHRIEAAKIRKSVSQPPVSDHVKTPQQFRTGMFNPSAETRAFFVRPQSTITLSLFNTIMLGEKYTGEACFSELKNYVATLGGLEKPVGNFEKITLFAKKYREYVAGDIKEQLSEVPDVGIKHLDFVFNFLFPQPETETDKKPGVKIGSV
ncbi:MAG: hypothetical protein WBJ21_01510 [Burkholderiaceae bacterium]